MSIPHDWEPAGGEERALVRRIIAAPAAPEPRAVYADWLAERADPRADLLRLLARVAAGRAPKRWQRQVRALREGVAESWLAVVDLAPVRHCVQTRDRQTVQFELPCPRRWEHLQPTLDAGVRFCGVCEARVYHCETATEARKHAAIGRCVSLVTDERVAGAPPSVRGFARLGRVRPRPHARTVACLPTIVRGESVRSLSTRPPIAGTLDRVDRGPIAVVLDAAGEQHALPPASLTLGDASA